MCRCTGCENTADGGGGGAYDDDCEGAWGASQQQVQEEQEEEEEGVMGEGGQVWGNDRLDSLAQLASVWSSLDEGLLQGGASNHQPKEDASNVVNVASAAMFAVESAENQAGGVSGNAAATTSSSGGAGDKAMVVRALHSNASGPAVAEPMPRRQPSFGGTLTPLPALPLSLGVPPLSAHLAAATVIQNQYFQLQQQSLDLQQKQQQHQQQTTPILNV